MYFVFESELRSWKNGILQAVLEGPLPKFEPHWWLAQPFSDPVPPLTFLVSSKSPKPDNLFTGTLSIELYTSRLVKLLEEAGVKYETFPAKIIDRKTKSELPIHYKAFHLLEIYPALDEEKSVINYQNYTIEKLVLKDKITLISRPLFRIKEHCGIVLIHKKLKETLEKAQITGCVFTPVESFRPGIVQ